MAETETPSLRFSEMEVTLSPLLNMVKIVTKISPSQNVTSYGFNLI